MIEDSCELLPIIGTHSELVQKLKSTQVVNCFLINIDNFSNINSAYGYEVGNKVLCSVVQNLHIVKSIDMALYRYSTDKFVLLNEKDLTTLEMQRTAETILSFFSNTELTVGKIELKISLSIGISKGIGLSNISNA
ncbi:MAG: diguanylate cyclase, partial [Campylobacterota bacterium]|nr:diguanylate cyclase [Campylobacterota bacterium]